MNLFLESANVILEEFSKDPNMSMFIKGSALGGLIAFLLLVGILIVLFILTAFYIYHSWTWMRIARKLGFKKPWLAWIPFANASMRLYLGGFHWAWIFLVLIPVFGWIALIVLLTIATWRIFEKIKYSGWLSLTFPAIFFPKIAPFGLTGYLVVIGLIAFGKRQENIKKGLVKKKKKLRK